MSASKRELFPLPLLGPSPRQDTIVEYLIEGLSTYGIWFVAGPVVLVLFAVNAFVLWRAI